MSGVATECAGGGLGVLSLFASFARTSRSRRFGERRKATTGTSLKMFLKRSVDCRMGCFLRNMSWMLGRAGLQVTVKGIRSLVSLVAGLLSFVLKLKCNLFCQFSEPELRNVLLVNSKAHPVAFYDPQNDNNFWNFRLGQNSDVILSRYILGGRGIGGGVRENNANRFLLYRMANLLIIEGEE